MRLIVCDNYQQLSDRAFEVMAEVINNKQDATLGLATGSSPVGLYQRMINDHLNKHTSYQKIKTFNLDEYVGIDVNHPQSYFSFMHRNLFDHIDIGKENVHIPSNQGTDLAENCRRYNQLLADNVLDIQLLGIGSNGHIGFNEPYTPFDSLTHIVDLKQSTINDNARFFNNDITQVPKKAITMGIANVMAAKKILLLATGENKARAIYQTIKGPISEACPSTILQKHQDVTVIVDKSAASLL
ncbi:MAG: glucosamine-6-phosphate deaminase [Erysipelotrichaceae bacterium]